MLAECGADPTELQKAEAAAGAAEILVAAGEKRLALAGMVAVQAREVALATLCGETAIEVAVVDRRGGILARVGGWPRGAC